MINGLGVLGWGVGGIEAEAAMLGQPVSMLMPEVVGFKLTGKLREGATGTDLVLRVTQMLRAKGVVGKFVEFYGRGPDVAAAARPRDDRQHGAGVRRDDGLLPGRRRDADVPALHRPRPGAGASWSRRTAKEQGLFRTDATPEPVFSRHARARPRRRRAEHRRPEAPAGPRAALDIEADWRKNLLAMLEHGAELDQTRVHGVAQRRAAARETGRRHAEPQPLGEIFDERVVVMATRRFQLRHGSVVIAAITCCTNTSNPEVMLAAGLLAKNAVERGLTTKPWVKTSLAPGSKVVTDYLDEAGLTPFLERSASISSATAARRASATPGRCRTHIANAIRDGNLVAAAVLSGNRNFEGRINPEVRANYLASPPLVVAYALAGHDGHRPPAASRSGTDSDGQPVFLRDIWPTQQQIDEAVRDVRAIGDVPRAVPRRVRGRRRWRNLDDPDGRALRLGPGLHVRQEPAVLRRHDDAAGADDGHQRRARAGDARRLGDDGPHLAGREHRRERPGRAST